MVYNTYFACFAQGAFWYVSGPISVSSLAVIAQGKGGLVTFLIVLLDSVGLLVCLCLFLWVTRVGTWYVAYDCCISWFYLLFFMPPNFGTHLYVYIHMYE